MKRGEAQVATDTGLPSCDRIEYRGESGTIYVQTDLDGHLQWGIYMHDPADAAGPWWVDVCHSSQATPGKVFHLVARHVTTDGEESRTVTNGCVIP